MTSDEKNQAWHDFRDSLGAWTPTRYNAMSGKPWQPAMAQGAQADAFAARVLGGGLRRLEADALSGGLEPEQMEQLEGWEIGSNKFGAWAGTDQEDEYRLILARIHAALGEQVENELLDAIKAGHSRSYGSRMAFFELLDRGMTPDEIRDALA